MDTEILIQNNEEQLGLPLNSAIACRPDSLAYLAEDLSPTILPRGRGGKIYK